MWLLLCCLIIQTLIQTEASLLYDSSVVFCRIIMMLKHLKLRLKRMTKAWVLQLLDMLEIRQLVCLPFSSRFALIFIDRDF